MNKPEKEFINKAKVLYELKELERLGLTPELDQRDQILAYMALLLKWNKVSNLVSKKDEDNLFIRHFCDSLQPLLLFGFKKNAHSLDLGSGGGFPAIPTRIFRPDLTITLVESIKKKAKFLKEVCEQLELENVDVFNGRLENLDPQEHKFDYIVSRGVGSLQKFSALAKPYLHEDGRMYTFKSKDFMEELEGITQNKDKDGVRIAEIAEYDLGNQIFGLNLVSLEKYSGS
ncbi:MAG: 16S rRNA (guanine(527)-N(7))-methyltransferase RsmG [Chitinivibrionales bacterium]|nr:16S rRNA (guanine(527)-N(7))-methyltransferase RsmG [Chitinivibrionales bacterium]